MELAAWSKTVRVGQVSWCVHDHDHDLQDLYDESLSIRMDVKSKSAYEHPTFFVMWSGIQGIATSLTTERRLQEIDMGSEVGT